MLSLYYVLDTFCVFWIFLYRMKYFGNYTLPLGLCLISLKNKEDQLEIGMWDHITCNFHATLP